MRAADVGGEHRRMIGRVAPAGPSRLASPRDLRDDSGPARVPDETPADRLPTVLAGPLVPGRFRGAVAQVAGRVPVNRPEAPPVPVESEEGRVLGIVVADGRPEAVAPAAGESV